MNYAGWRQFAGEIGAEYVEGGLSEYPKVRVHVKEWTVTLDVYDIPRVEAAASCRLE
jgi:hypothetical protein